MRVIPVKEVVQKLPRASSSKKGETPVASISYRLAWRKQRAPTVSFPDFLTLTKWARFVKLLPLLHQRGIAASGRWAHSGAHPKGRPPASLLQQHSVMAGKRKDHHAVPQNLPQFSAARSVAFRRARRSYLR